MYKYEPHLHTFPVSKCAVVDIYETVDFYKSIGYDGVFITNHFIDGNINIDATVSYEEKINFYFSDYEKAKEYADSIGFKVFCGVEMSYKGTDFLVYGLDKEWYLANPQITSMKKTEELSYMMNCGALVIQAHPYREAGYIDHIRLFPRSVHGVEVINSSCKDFENDMAKAYAQSYGLIEFAGSDNHRGRGRAGSLAGMCSDIPIADELDFVQRVKNGEMKTFFDKE